MNQRVEVVIGLDGARLSVTRFGGLSGSDMTAHRVRVWRGDRVEWVIQNDSKSNVDVEIRNFHRTPELLAERKKQNPDDDVENEKLDELPFGIQLGLTVPAGETKTLEGHVKKDAQVPRTYKYDVACRSWADDLCVLDPEMEIY